MKCMVLFCKMSGRTPGVKYFSLTSSRHDAWMRALGRDPTIEHLTKNNSVCSEHFMEQDKFVENNRCQLKPGAIPRLKLGIRKPLLPVKQETLEESIVSEIWEPDIHSIKLELKTEENILQDSSTDHQEEYDFVKQEYIYTPYTTKEIRSSNNTSVEYSFSSMTPLPSITSLNRGSVDMTSSVMKSNKVDIERARRDVELIHSYSTSPKKLIATLEKTRRRKNVTYKKLRNCQRRIKRLTNQVSSLEEEIQRLIKDMKPGCISKG